MEMNEAQSRFVRCKNSKGRTPKRRLFEAGNKCGKCLTYQSLISTPDGDIEVGKLYEEGNEFWVYAYHEGKRIKALASAPFKKQGLHQCYRIELEDGRWIEAADHHYILTSCGWQTVFDLQESFVSLQESNSDTYLSVLPSGVVHLSGNESDCQGDCFGDYRQCGGQLRTDRDNGLVSVPLQDGVQPHDEPLSHGDGRAYRCTNSDRLGLCHPSSYYARFLSGGQYVVSSTYDERISSQWHSYSGPTPEQFSIAVDVQPQSCVESSQSCQESHRSQSASLTSGKYGNKIISFKPIGSQEVYDFEVYGYHTYYAGGMVHHNTNVGIAEDIAHAIGYRPWLSEDDPDYKVPIRIPNNGLVGCETMAHSVTEKLAPEFEKLIPSLCMPTYKKNPQGYLVKITLENDGKGNKCGSTIYFRSYDQEPRTFEGIDYDWLHWDEPPPEPVLMAAERGKIARNAASWFTMTPLKEPYIYDKFSLKAPYDDEIEVIRGEIWENCIDYCKKCDLDISENRERDTNEKLVRPVDRCPKCGQIMGFILREGIDEYLKTLDPDEREAREKGVWKHLSGLVYKQFDREVHVVEDFRIPKHWNIVEAVDPHDSRPIHWLFAAISPEDIEVFGKKANRIYVFDSVLLKGDIEESVRQVLARRKLHGYDHPKMVILDAKYGAKTQMEGRSWQTELEKNGIKHIKLSESKPGDVPLGHKIVKEYLKEQYSKVEGKSKPGLVFFKDACGGEGKPIQYMMNYQYKEGADKPEEKFKDWPDCVRYICLESPKYRDPSEDKQINDTLNDRYKKALASRRREIYV